MRSTAGDPRAGPTSAGTRRSRRRSTPRRARRLSDRGRPDYAGRHDASSPRPLHRAARAERAEPHRRQDHAVRRLDAVRLRPHPVVRRLDRLPGREVPVRPADDDRLARGDLPVDVRDDLAEPRRREARGALQSPVEDDSEGGRAESAPADADRAHPRPLEADPRLADTDARADADAERPPRAAAGQLTAEARPIGTMQAVSGLGWRPWPRAS